MSSADSEMPAPMETLAEAEAQPNVSMRFPESHQAKSGVSSVRSSRHDLEHGMIFTMIVK